jgi:hypothetical protein
MQRGHLGEGDSTEGKGKMEKEQRVEEHQSMSHTFV